MEYVAVLSGSACVRNWGWGAAIGSVSGKACVGSACGAACAPAGRIALDWAAVP